MYNLNKLSSPMHILEENLNDTENTRQKKINFIKLRELSKSPHCIGSVNEIETKVTKLEEQIKNIQTSCSFIFSDTEDEDVQKEDYLQEVRHDQQEKKEIAQFAGVFSVVSTYSFNKPERIRKIAKRSIKSDKQTAKDSDEKSLPKFIELCDYPGFDNLKSTPLPCNISPEFILQRVYDAQAPFITSFQKFFEKWFLSKIIQDILQDIFWFFFVAKYGSDLNRNDLSNYFARTATNYVRFLLNISKEPLYHQEKFKKKLPNLLSQSLYAALSESFPDSWVQFDEDFLERIVVLIYFWFAGIRCTRGIWRKWNMQELKPSEQKEREKKIEEQSKQGLTDYQTDKKTIESVSLEKKRMVKSTVIGPLNQSRCVLLNLNGQSPLVQYYLHTKIAKTNVGNNTVIKHVEITPMGTDEHSLTYSKVIARTTKDQKNRSDNFHRYHEKNVLEMKKFQKSQRLASLDNDRKQEKLLNNGRLVHNLSNLMVHEYLKDKGSISFNADAIIRDTIAAIQ